MNRAFAVAKRVRSETGISQSAVSISYAAVELARKIFGDLTGKTVMIIGASKMGELAAKHLKRNGVSSVLVTNRTFERAVELAKVFEGAAIPFEHFTDHIDRADIVISSTGAPHFIITEPMAEQIIRNRRNKPCSSSISPCRATSIRRSTKSTMSFLYDIDDLQQVIDCQSEGADEGSGSRRRDRRSGSPGLLHADAVARGRSDDRAAPRDVSRRVRRDEIERHRKLLRDLPPEQQQAALGAIDQITQSLVNKILHHPISQLKEMADDPQGAEFVETVRKIFNIKLQ